MTPTLRQASADGWTITRTNGGHLRLTHPAAAGPIFAASTPSCHRAEANLEAMLRRALPTETPTRTAKPKRRKRKRRRAPTGGYEHPTAAERLAAIMRQAERRLACELEHRVS